MRWRHAFVPGALGWLALAAAAPAQSLDVPDAPAAPTAPSAPAAPGAPAPAAPGSPAVPAIPPGGSGGQLGVGVGFNLDDGQGKNYNWDYRYRWDNGQGQEDNQLRTSPSQPGTGVNLNFGSSLGYNSGDGAAPQPLDTPDAPDGFGVGDSADTLAKIQGQPDRVNRYPALGYDRWWYGQSFVKVDSASGAVLGWSNAGRNLRLVPDAGQAQDPAPPPAANNNVSLWSNNAFGVSVGAPPPQSQPAPAMAELQAPPPQPAPIAAPAYFDKGSSAADVRSVQGQPDSITPYPALGYDIWRYGYSQVKVSTMTGQVVDWANISRNLRTPPADQP